MTLTFFCELESDALQSLFADDALFNDLKALNAAISLGLIDLSAERAAVVRRLNTAGIPVIAWMLLPKEQGYWFNADNADAASARYEAFKVWTNEYHLRWYGVGLDIEPDRNFVEGAMTDRRKLIESLRHLRSVNQVHEAQATYSKLVKRIRADGYRVDAYHIPLVIDERWAGSLLLQRAAGLVDVSVDRDVLMLYTSFLGDFGVGALWSYGSDTDSIAVGSTGGGVEIGELPRMRLNWNSLARDLRLAYAHTDDIHIFSLEGCVRQGFMERLKTFNWNSPVSVPIESLRRMQVLRLGIRGVLWAWAHPGMVAMAVASAGEFAWRYYWWKRKRNGAKYRG